MMLNGGSFVGNWWLSMGFITIRKLVIVRGTMMVDGSMWHWWWHVGWWLLTVDKWLTNVHANVWQIARNHSSKRGNTVALHLPWRAKKVSHSDKHGIDSIHRLMLKLSFVWFIVFMLVSSKSCCCQKMFDNREAPTGDQSHVDFTKYQPVWAIVFRYDKKN